jgi:hypothetical protein
MRKLFIILLILLSRQSFSQSHDLDFKVCELTHGTGANIANVKVDLDDGKYIGFTDANGVAHIHDVNDGTHSIKIAKQGYIQFLQDGYTLSSDKTFNASIINKTRVGPWGTDNFNVSWWRQTNAFVGTTMFNIDNPRWKQIAPIFNRISNDPSTNPFWYYPDSVLIVAAISEIEIKTGYNLITLVPTSTSPDTTFTLYPRIGNVSNIEFDENYIISTGYSKFGPFAAKRIIHEIVMQFGMWSIGHLAYPSVMEPSVSDMVDMQPWDADHVAVTFDQHYAKSRGEQDLFLGNMMEYVTPTIPASTSITLPINNATDLEKIVRFTYNNSSGTDKYHLDIATDASFTNLIQDLMIYRVDTSITLNNDQQYYARVQTINTAGSSSWSSTIAFHTQIPTGINDLNLNKEFKVYPNPAKDFVTIESLESNSTNFDIQFFSSDGILVKSLKSGENNTINLSDLLPGLYYLRISDTFQKDTYETLTLIKK